MITDPKKVPTALSTYRGTRPTSSVSSPPRDPYDLVGRGDYVGGRFSPQGPSGMQVRQPDFDLFVAPVDLCLEQ
jgi:hypothetical protein